LIACAILAAPLPRLASAAPTGRHIPTGELNPQVIEKVFDSPRGEVQFTVEERTRVHGGYLRNVKGHLMAFTEVRGGGECEEWFSGTKGDAVPRGCEFLFYDNADGRSMLVKGEELRESDIFGMASGEIQSVASGVRGSENGGPL
jgi:hypothetical protein